MTKSGRTSSPSSRVRGGLPSPDESIERALEKLRDHYKTGKDAVDAFPEEAKADGKSIARLAKEKGVSTSEIRQARLFRRNYTEEEFEELILLRCKGMPFTWDHVKGFIKVKSKAKRTAIQEEAAKKSWSIKALRRVIRARRLDRSKENTTRRAGGRRHAKESSAPIALVQILDLSRRWSRYYSDSGVGGPDSPLKNVSRVSRRDREVVQDQIRETISALDELGAAVASVIKQLQRSDRELNKAKREDRKASRAKTDGTGPAKTPNPPARGGGSGPKAGPRKQARKRPPK